MLANRSIAYKMMKFSGKTMRNSVGNVCMLHWTQA